MAYSRPEPTPEILPAKSRHPEYRPTTADATQFMRADDGWRVVFSEDDGSLFDCPLDFWALIPGWGIEAVIIYSDGDEALALGNANFRGYLRPGELLENFMKPTPKEAAS